MDKTIGETMQKDPYARYRNDFWYFGILLVTGKTLVIDNIDNVYDEYIEVTMIEQCEIKDLCEHLGTDRFMGASGNKPDNILEKMTP